MFNIVVILNFSRRTQSASLTVQHRNKVLVVIRDTRNDLGDFIAVQMVDCTAIPMSNVNASRARLDVVLDRLLLECRGHRRTAGASAATRASNEKSVTGMYVLQLMDKE
jgi:hypothetical protein